MGIIKDTLSLGEGSMVVQVTVAGKEYKLSAHLIADGVVCFTPSGFEGSKGVPCRAKQTLQSMYCLTRHDLSEKHVQIGLLLANMHEALRAAGAQDEQIRSALENLLDKENFRE